MKNDGPGSPSLLDSKSKLKRLSCLDAPEHSRQVSFKGGEISQL